MADTIMGPPYEIKEKPIYNTDIKSIATSTPVHASVMNQTLLRMIENTEAVKQIADSKASPETGTGETDGLLGHLDKQKYDEAVRIVNALLQHYPESGTAGGDLIGTYPNPEINPARMAEVAQIFSQAGIRGNVTSGDTLAIALGKLAKWYSDLKSVAWSGNYGDLSGRPAAFPAEAHTHDDRYYTESEINVQMAGRAAASHGHGAWEIGAGTLAGVVTANSNGEYTMRQVRNVVMSADTGTATSNGDVYHVYK